MNCLGVVMVYMTSSYFETFLGKLFLTNMFVIMTAIFCLFLILFVLNIKTIKKELKISKKTALILLLIFLFGFFLRNVEYRYGWGLDGLFYPTSAKYLIEQNIFTMGCAIGNVNQCVLYHQPLYPAGYPYLISILYLLFGINSIYAMQLSAIFSSLTIIIVFYCASILLKNEEAGLYGAVIFTLIPLELYAAGTSAARPTSLFFIGLTLLFYLISLKKDDAKMWCLTAITLSYSIYVRQENIVLLFPIFLGLFLFKYNYKDFTFKINKKEAAKFFYAIIILIVTLIPFFYLTFSQLQNSSPRQPTFSFEYFRIMAPIMLSNMFSTKVIFFQMYFNPFISGLVFFSTIFLLKEYKRKELIFSWSIFVAFFLVISFYYQTPGFPKNFSADYLRFMQDLNFPCALIAGFTIFQTREIIKKKTKINGDILMAATLLLTLLILLPTSDVKFPNTMFKDGRLDENSGYVKVGDLIMAINNTPNDCLIITSQDTLVASDILKNNQRSVVDIELIKAFNGKMALDEMKKASCIRFLKDYRCNSNADELCQYIDSILNLTFLFKQGTVEVYDGKLKNVL